MIVSVLSIIVKETTWSSEEGKAEMKVDDKLALGFRGSMLKNHKVD